MTQYFDPNDELSPSNLIKVRSPIGSGRVEEDDFLINDVALTIPPSQIQIDKLSYNTEWETLRTRSSQSAKTGHGMVSVSLDVIFEGYVDINFKLRPLVAGLRATPFCTVRNKYIEGMLQHLNPDTEIVQRYKQFQPVALALTTMTFTTLGHAGMPSGISGHFEFIWFNYFPYMPIFCYKTGPGFSTPGVVEDCALWMRFYEPFLEGTKAVDFPDKMMTKPTSVLWKEFLTITKGDSSSCRAALDLLDTIQRKPNEFFANYGQLAETGPTDVSKTNFFDKLYNKLEKSGALVSSLSSSERRSVAVGVGGLGANDELIYRMGQRVVNGLATSESAVNESKKELERAVAEITKRREDLQKFETLNSNLPEERWVRLKDLEPEGNIKVGKASFNLGTLEIYGRDRELTLGYDNDFVVQQTSITFQNFLSVIPMIGYSYPTCQFLGSQGAVVSLSINGSNEAIASLNRVFDTIEKNTKKFRALPQSILNIWVENDFLALFGLKEFLTSRLSSSTIEDQPGRSFANLELQSAGITTRDGIKEEIEQEFVQSDKEARRMVWDILAKYLQEGDPRRDKNTDSTIDGWKLVRWGIVPDDRSKHFVDLVDKARDIYNRFLKKVHSKIFNTDNSVHEALRFAGQFASGTNSTELHLLITGVSAKEFGGFVPFLEKLQRTVMDRERMSSTRTNVPWQASESFLKKFNDDKFSVFSSKDKLKQDIEHRELKNKALVMPDGSGKYKEISTEEGIIISNDTPEEQYRARQKILGELGFFEYLDSMTKLLDDIILKYSYLPQFAGIKGLKKSLGLGKGNTAYPDFKSSIRAMARDAEGGRPSDANLLDYEPDAYLWYPAYDGSIDITSFGSLIDPELLSIAKQYSMEAFNTAQGSVGNFFQNNYIKTLKTTSEVGGDRNKTDPYSRLNSFLKDGKMSVPLYNDMTSSNFTAEEEVKHGFVSDPGKSNINWYPSKNMQVKGTNILSNSTDFKQVWDGISSEQSNQGNPAQEDFQPITTGGKGTPAGYNRSGSGLGVDPDFTTTWPHPFSTQAPVNGIVSPIAFYSSKNNPFGVRDVGQTKAGFDYRKVSAKKDWSNTSIRKQLNNVGYHVSPDIAAQEMGKPVSEWNFDEYTAWSQKTSPKLAGARKLAYLHKGIDVFAPLGTDVYSIADGVVHSIHFQAVLGAGVNVMIAHHSGDIKLSCYFHLQGLDPSLSVGQPIKQGQCIGVVGRSGQNKMVVHLHFETWGDSGRVQLLNPDNVPWTNKRNTVKRYSPPKNSPQEQRVNQIKQEYLAKDITTTLASPLMETIKDLEVSLLTGQGQTLRRAYPTFKLYFIEDDSNERQRKAFDDFYSYSSVKSIEVIRDEEIAADLCVIEVTNISGILTNRKFRNEGYQRHMGSEYRATNQLPRDKDGKIVEEAASPTDVNTINENPLASFVLQEGMHIHLRLGYNSDPELLEPVFNGIITGIEISETDDLIQIIAQSYAIELVQDIKGVESPNELSTPWWSFLGFRENASTGRVLEELMCSPEVVHFGRWHIGSSPTFNRDLLTNKWQFQPNPADDNIFAPPYSVEKIGIGTGILDVFKDLQFTIFRTTIWDVFKEMELRCPNFIAAPLPFRDFFGERMTMFFGLPHYLYFSRCPTQDEQSAQQQLINAQADAKKVADERVKDALRNGPIGFNSVVWEPDKVDNLFRLKRLAEAKQAGYIKPFRQYHLLTSGNHIVSNNIQTDSQNVANSITVNYTGPSSFKMLNKAAKALYGSSGAEASLTVKLDNAIPDEDLRTQVISPINVVNEELAKRYACGQLVKNIRNSYKGEIIVLGSPKIRPKDICMVMDEVSDITGPIEVRRVVHYFSRDSGFVTEITPGLLASVAEWSTVSTSQAMGVIIEGLNRKLLGMDRNSIGWGSKLSGWALWLAGGSMTQKIITWTQLGQPIVMSPLIHHGKPFLGGLPTRKLPQSIWQVIFGSWYPGSDTEFSNWTGEIGQRVLSIWKKWTFQKTTGDFYKGFSGNTLPLE